MMAYHVRTRVDISLMASVMRTCGCPFARHVQIKRYHRQGQVSPTHWKINGLRSTCLAGRLFRHVSMLQEKTKQGADR